MAKVFFRSLFLGILTLLVVHGDMFGQYNPQHQYRDVIDTEYHSSFINSAQTPVVISQTSIGEVEIDATPVSENRYKLSYRPGKIEANTQAVIEYWTIDENSTSLRPDYTTINFRITRSLISCGDDFATTDVNTTINGIKVLENDSRTHGPLTLVNIAYADGGFASIDNDKIDFTPDADFSGDAFVYYVVKDNVDKYSLGKLKIKVFEFKELPGFDEINIISYGGVPVEINLPYEGFQVADQVSFGSFEVVNGAQVYIPNGNFNANESFHVTKDYLTRKINVRIIEEIYPNSWVNDDVVYTSKGTPVTFDVEKNDLKKNQEIISYSSELIQGSAESEFTYNPEPHFIGGKTFEYTVYNGYESETGKIHLKVNNFFPQKKYDYNFKSLSNTALVIDYQIPIYNYSFELISGPANGSLSINSGTVTMNMGCVEVSGTNLVIYEPDYNYIGSDQFELKYCVDGQCENISIEVEIAANNLTDCKCYTGCVWAGDANNDGLVNVVDLLTMSYALGASGSETLWNGESGWVGRKTEDWIYNSTLGMNAKFSDSDGNGVIEEIDFDAITEHYDKNHALVPPQLLDNKSYPFTLNPVQDTVFIGDRIEFEIGVGTEEYPAIDVHGLAFSLGMPGSLVDSSSVNVTYNNDSWLGIDQDVYSISHQVTDGWIETAVARLGIKSKSGAGVLGKLDFIVEEDVVGGFRVSKGIIPITVKIEEGQALSGDGQMGKVKGVESIVYLDIRNKQSDNPQISRLVAFPNPASNVINLHMNGGHEIISYEMFDLMGRKLLSSKPNNPSRSATINSSTYTNGTYIVRAQTTFGSQIQKIEIAN